MDTLQKKITNLTMYDVKSAFRKAQNVMMNYNEMEAKVREATTNDPWGASSTAMQEIAQGTYNDNYFNEIMHMIYRRFTEKTAEEWRQIYKALQLLEYLIKNGSERVVDDARAHQATIKVLRQFYYIDDKMVDQGLNVRNRAKQVLELLLDSDKIRTERRKAKQGRQKYIGNAAENRGFGGSGSRYGGFSSSSYYSDRNGAYPSSSSRVYGSGGGFESDVADYSKRIYGDGGGFGGESPRILAMKPGQLHEKEYDTKKSDPGAITTKDCAITDLLDLGDESNTIKEDDDDFDAFQSAVTPNVLSLNPQSLLSSSPVSSAKLPATFLKTPNEPLSNTLLGDLSAIEPKTSESTNNKGDSFSTLWSSAKSTNLMN